MSRSWRCFALAALGCGVALAALAKAHPVAPWLALILGLLVATAEFRRPGLFLALLPACLPWMNWAPWTGWTMVEEFDLLVLAVAAGGYARLAFPADPGSRTEPAASASRWMPPLPWAFWAFSIVAVISLVRGLLDADAGVWSWFADYTDCSNSVRTFKSLVWCWLLVPLLWRACHDDTGRAWRRLELGMCAGLVVVGGVALWERAAYPGLTDFAAVYRVTALFWEMHVGGSAIDTYLALALPFAALAITRGHNVPTRLLALVALVLGLHAVVATMSRLALAGALCALIAVAVLSWLGRSAAVRRWTAWSAAAGLAGAAAVLWFGWMATMPESFLGNRLRQSGAVLEARLDHWRSAFDMLRSPSEHWLGIGLGRFTARYIEAVDGGGLPGATRYVPAQQGVDGGRPYVMIRGPSDGPEQGGHYGLTQRIPSAPEARYIVTGASRSATGAELLVRVCQRHLLYDAQCQGAILELSPGDHTWRSFSVALEGERFDLEAAALPRSMLFSVSVLTPDAQVDISEVGLAHDETGGQLENGDFARGLARWFPSAQYFFRPWHADSFWLELQVERGLLGVLACVAWLVAVAASLMRSPSWNTQAQRVLAAGLAGVLVVGIGASLLDVPRIAFLLQFLWLFPVVAFRHWLEQTQATPAEPSTGAGSV